MIIGLISRLKKSKKSVTVIDSQGNATDGVISHWDDVLFSVLTEDGDDVFFPLQNACRIILRGGLEKREPLTHETDE